MKSNIAVVAVCCLGLIFGIFGLGVLTGRYYTLCNLPKTNSCVEVEFTELNYRLSMVEQDVDNIYDRLSDADIQSMRWKILMIDAELSKMQGNKNIGE